MNDQAGSRSHTHYSQTEITTHHMKYQNKVQLWRKRQNQRELSASKGRKETSVEVSAKKFIKLQLTIRQAVDRILTTVKRKLPRITRNTRTRYSPGKNDKTRELSASKGREETYVEVSAKELIKLQ